MPRQKTSLSVAMEIEKSLFPKIAGLFETQQEWLEGRLSSFGGKFTSIDGKLNSIDRRFDVVDQRFDTMGKRFDTIGKRFDTLKGEIIHEVKILMENDQRINIA